MIIESSKQNWIDCDSMIDMQHSINQLINNQNWQILIANIKKMGSICHYLKKEELENYRVHKNEEQQAIISNCQCHFTLASPAHLQADCLLIFTDDHCKINQNLTLLKADEHIGYQAQAYLDAHLATQRMIVGDCALLQISLEHLPVKYLAILCVEIWPGGTGELMAPLEEDIEEALRKISEKGGIERVLVSQINPELGIPLQIGRRTLCRALVGQVEKFEEVTILCSSEESKEEHSATMAHENKRRMKLSISSDIQEKPERESDYY